MTWPEQSTTYFWPRSKWEANQALNQLFFDQTDKDFFWHNRMKIENLAFLRKIFRTWKRLTQLNITWPGTNFLVWTHLQIVVVTWSVKWSEYFVFLCIFLTDVNTAKVWKRILAPSGSLGALYVFLSFKVCLANFYSLKTCCFWLGTTCCFLATECQEPPGLKP